MKITLKTIILVALFIFYLVIILSNFGGYEGMKTMSTDKDDATNDDATNDDMPNDDMPNDDAPNDDAPNDDASDAPQIKKPVKK